MDYIKKIIEQYEMNSVTTDILTYSIAIILIILLCIISNYITQKIVLRLITHIINKNTYQWDNFFLERKVFRKLSHLVPALIIYYFAILFPAISSWIEKGAFAYIFIVLLSAFNAFLNAINDIYLTFEVSKEKPIRGYIQVLKIILFIVGGIVLIATFIGQNPLILLSGLGAISAVLMLIFKDSILGLVAGIQLSANDMVRVGDWIEMPKYQADGDIVDITLNTVKVKNWDKTITMIPSYALISDSFKNWRGMTETGGRRIKRSIYIDTSSIQFCSHEMIEKFKNIHYLTDYIESKEIEIEEYNRDHAINPTIRVNGRNLTNIGTYRMYIYTYLTRHPDIHKQLTTMVRQLAPGEYGLPLEIYTFTSDIRWTVYEDIQSDIFDHILAIAPEFGLRIFQNPTGHDMRNMNLRPLETNTLQEQSS